MRANPVGARGGGQPRFLFLSVLIPFGIGYYLSYLYRSLNAVISPRLVDEVGLGPADLGFLTSVYFITFAAFQIPLGVLLDRYGPRRVQTILLLIAASGGLLFSAGESFVSLCVGRALIGLGVSGCLMAALKANATWWPAERLPLMNNIIGAFGSFGALSATTPVELMLQIASWREILFTIAIAAAVCAVAIYSVVPEAERADEPVVSWRDAFAGYPEIFKNPFFWRLGAVFVSCHAAFLTYQTLWAAPWLRDVARLERQAVADHLFLIQLGMFIGILSIGALADRLLRIGIAPAHVFIGAMIVYVSLQVVLACGVTWQPGVIWFLVGFFTTGTFLCFAILTERFPKHLTARVMTSANLLIFVFAFVAQWGVGVIIGLFPLVEAGRYSSAAHGTAFFVLIAVQVLAIVWFLWPRRDGR